MAKYNVTSLNYINVGSKRVFVNMDSELDYSIADNIYLLSTEQPLTLSQTGKDGDIRTESTYTTLCTNFIAKESDDPTLPVSKENHSDEIILCEIQDNVTDFDPNQGEYIRLFKSDSTQKNKNLRDRFHNQRIQMNQTFLIEKDQYWKNVLRGSDACEILPMYDMKDVCVKSYLNSGKINYNLDHSKNADDFVNIYTPDMDVNPIGFCQQNNGSMTETYVMMDSSHKDTYMFEIDKYDTRKTTDDTTYYDMTLKSGETKTYLYMELSDTGYQTYGDYISSFGYYISQCSSIFEPKKNMVGLNRNYIVDIPDSSIDSEYESGNVHGDIYTGKNAYNALYSMEVLSGDQIRNCRSYCGIDTSANKVYLKFYDNLDYSPSQVKDSDNVKNIQMVEEKHRKYPYQKIEFMNKNTFTNKCKHKSTLFSVRIQDLDKLSESSIQQTGNVGSADGSDPMLRNALFSKLQKDIRSAIEDIVRNVSPANTQLFKVYFGD